jgi:hypothetical protein
MAGKRKLNSQTIAFEEIDWDKSKTKTAAPKTNPSGTCNSLPLGTSATEPYWVFSYEVNPSFGLQIRDIKAINTQSAGSEEPVIKLLEFAEITVTFSDGTTSSFDINSALNNASSTFMETEYGTLRPTSSYNPHTTPDPSCQRGLYLKLVDTFGGTCQVEVELSAVFRKSFADFDPGNIPIAMKIFPHVSMTWYTIGTSGRKVTNFHCTVKTTLQNCMSMDHGSMSEDDMAGMANTAGFFTDSNAAFDTWDTRNLSDGLLGLAALGAKIDGKPFGWSMVFDYLRSLDKKSGQNKETEIIGVYGPNDTGYFDTERSKDYGWGFLSWIAKITCRKAPRQGMYDNIHVHATMPDDTHGNSPMHAPFCGHSCFHLHWRWSKTSSDGAEDPARKPTYKGWSRAQTITTPRSAYLTEPVAFSTTNAPLIPPTHRLKLAVTDSSTSRHSSTAIINSSAPGDLPDIDKTIWYEVDIIRPKGAYKQVIMEHGMGWAYGYNWNTPVQGLAFVMDEYTLLGYFLTSHTPTQQELSDFFSNKIYPAFRYFDADDTSSLEQIPQGSYKDSHTVSMENL